MLGYGEEKEAEEDDLDCMKGPAGKPERELNQKVYRKSYPSETETEKHLDKNPLSLSPEKMASPHRSWKEYLPISNSSFETDLYTIEGIPNAHNHEVVMQDSPEAMPSVNVNDGNVNPNVNASDGNENPNADAKRR